MKNCFYAALMLLLPVAVPAFGTVIVSSPSNGTTVGSSAQYTASATSTCQQGVTAMGVYVDNQLAYIAYGASLNTSLPISSGSHNTYVQEWDQCGGSSGTSVQVTAGGQSGVHVTLPADNSTVSSNVSFVASATTSCAQGVAAIGVYANSQLIGVSQGATLNKQLVLGAGPQRTVVQSWDNCGSSSTQQINLTVQDSINNVRANAVSDIQAAGNWNQWGELAPVYDICSPCAGVNWNMTQNVSSVSLSGNATRFDIGGSVPYSDVLWSNKIIGQGTTKNMPDIDRKILPNIHNLVYDTDVFVTDFAVTQDLEFDVNMYLDGAGMEWGTECNHLADGDWDVWDNVNAHWVSTGVPCSLNSNAWNHVTFEAQRLSDNSLVYETITVNGVTANINKTFPPFQVPSGWYGMTVNYQMDGNYRMASNTTYLDNLTIKYW
jgi:hypothetical protein